MLLTHTGWLLCGNSLAVGLQERLRSVWGCWGRESAPASGLLTPRAFHPGKKQLLFFLLGQFIS